MFKRHNGIQLAETTSPSIKGVKLDGKILGKIDTTRREAILYKKPINIHRNTNSISINKEWLYDESLYYNYIRVKLGREELLTTRRYWQEKGFEMSYLGYEPQIFLGLDEFGLDNAKVYEKINPAQHNLFGDDYLQEIEDDER